MAMIKCPECGVEISDKAKKCPHCGYPIKKSKGRRISQIIICTLVVIIVIIIVLFLALSLNKESIDNYVGQTYQHVIDNGKLDQYKIEIKEEASDNVEEGTIIQQYINYEEDGKKIRSIMFVVSTGQDAMKEETIIEYPDVIGLDIEDAIKTLRDKGFTSIIAKDKLNTQYDWNEVYEIDPREVTESVSYKTTITLTYNKPALVKIPDIRGNAFTEKETAILDLGFKEYDCTFTSDDHDKEFLVDIQDNNSKSLIGAYAYTDEKIVLKYSTKKNTEESTPVQTQETTANTSQDSQGTIQKEQSNLVSSNSTTSGYTFTSNVFCQDEQGLNVEFIGVEDPASNLERNYIAVKFMVTNNNESDTTVLMRGFTINDCNFETSGGAANIAAGAKSIVRCKVNKDTLNEYGISSIDKVSGYYWLSVNNTYTSRFTINTR